MKKCSLLLSSLLVSLFFVTACQHSGNKKNEIGDSLKPEVVSTDEAKVIIEENKGNENFVLLDVRTNGEFKEGYLIGHLPEPDEPITDEDIKKDGDKARFRKYRGVLQHNRYASDFDEWLLTLDKAKRYLIYCRTQNRSKQAFDKLKATGFKQIQYMYGGYTQWALEGKPVEIPEYEKALDVLITGDKIKTKSNIKFDFVVSDLDGDPKRHSNLSIQVLSLPNATEVATKTEKMGDHGEGTYTFDASSKAKGKYRLVCKATYKYKDKDNNEINFKAAQAYYDFEVANDDEAVSGNSNEITIIPEVSDINATNTKRFYNRNVYGYKASNREKKIITLQEQVDTSKPTLMIFFSPECPGCMTKAQELVKYKLDAINLIPIITSIDAEKDLGENIADAEGKLKNQFHLDSIVPITLYDVEDKISFSRFKFRTTPKFVLINKEGQVKDMVHGGETLKIETVLKKMQDKFGLAPFQKN